jgi:photosystem II oxygen-evolving enhancer protein 2
VNNLSIIQSATDKGDISGYGPPEKFLEQVSFLLGKQTFGGAWRARAAAPGECAAPCAAACESCRPGQEPLRLR